MEASPISAMSGGELKFPLGAPHRAVTINGGVKMGNNVLIVRRDTHSCIAELSHTMDDHKDRHRWCGYDRTTALRRSRCKCICDQRKLRKDRKSNIIGCRWRSQL